MTLPNNIGHSQPLGFYAGGFGAKHVYLDGAGSGDGSGKPGAGTAPDAAGDKKFTQAEVDAAIEARIARERGKYADYDDVKKKAAELEKLNNDRAVSDAAGAKKFEEALDLTKKQHTVEIEKLTTELKTVQGRFESLAIDNVMLQEATKLNAINPAQVVKLQRENVKLGADGNASFVDGKTIADGLKAFLAENAHLVKAGVTGGGSGAANNGAGGGGAVSTAKSIADFKTVEEYRAAGGAEFVRSVAGARSGHPWERKPKKE